MATKHNSLIDVPGLLVGNFQDKESLTGCTVIISEDGAFAGVDQRGGAPGTRETDLLRTSHLVNKINAVLLTGGSAFGLDAAAGVMQYLSEKGMGFKSGIVRVPIVPAAVIYDLGVGNSNIRPTAEMGYQACLNATKDSPLQGNIGAGSGASVGKILGMASAMKSGLGSASMDIGGGVIVSALCIVNAFGDIIDHKTGQIIAGARTRKIGPLRLGNGEYFADTLSVMKSFLGRNIFKLLKLSNTVVGVVATNATLSKEESNKVAQMAQNGLALTIRPAHTMYDGDTIFALSTHKKRSDVNLVGAFAAQVVAEAILNAIVNSEPAGNLPSFQSYDS